MTMIFNFFNKLLTLDQALAQTQVPVVPNQPNDTLDNFPTLSSYLGELFPLLVKIVAAIAVLTIAYWGIMNMLSNIPGMRKASSERIWATLGGLILALAAWLILDTINPAINESLNIFK